MKTKIVIYKKHWRDMLVVLTAILVLGSLVLVGYGIRQNTELAAQSKQHIDCIIKDLATPIPTGSKSRYIDNLQTDCKIKFTQ